MKEASRLPPPLAFRGAAPAPRLFSRQVRGNYQSLGTPPTQRPCEAEIRESAVTARACSISHRRALYIEVRLPLTRAALHNMLFMVHTACPGYYINLRVHVIHAPCQILCPLISKLV